MRKFYKGDIVFREEEEELHWGVSLIGVVKSVTCDSWKLFHRPFINWIKDLFN
jgi:hypothetical protein